MTVSVFASGSGGNCLLLSMGGTHILIDAGISMRRTVSFLAQQGLTIQDLSGVLITHEHSDHISGLDMLLKHSSLSLFAPRTVVNHLRGAVPACERRCEVIPVGAPFALGGLTVTAFHTSHDTDESVGYRINAGGESFAIATDTGCVTEEIRSALLGAETVLLEANHDEDLLRFGPYPYGLKKRILSERGHLSNAACAVLAGELARRGTKRLILGHLSRENNTPQRALSAVEPAISGTGTALWCAPVLGPLTISEQRIRDDGC